MSFLDKYRVGETKYLVYYHKGEIRVQEGYTGRNHSFVLVHEDRWLTTAPYEYMKITRKGRVLVKNKEDIPIAKQMIREYYANKVDEVKDRAITALTNIKKIVEEKKMTKGERLRRWYMDIGLRLNSLAMQLPDEVLKANGSTLKQIEDLCLLVTEVKGYEKGEPNDKRRSN